MSLELAALCGFAFLAGFVDAVAGGGGLIQVPALFLLMPQAAPAALLGTNKFASVWGTLSAAVQYGRQVPVAWGVLLPAALAAWASAFLGAQTVARIPAPQLQPLILGLLLLVLVYTLWNKNFGEHHAPRLDARRQRVAGLAAGALLGFYDGFFGPGTGSFLIFVFVGVFGFGFVAASASAKIINAVTNLAALSYFASHSQVLYGVALPMAVCNVGGALLGARLALRRGNRFVRGVFLIVVSLLLLRLAGEWWLEKT